MTDTYPFPGDSQLARARRVARAYRQALQDVDPGVCDGLDVRCRGWGETWVLPGIATYQLDSWLTVREAADVAAVKPATLRVWRSRGLLTGHYFEGHWRYLARDVLAVSSQMRRRSKDSQPSTLDV